MNATAITTVPLAVIPPANWTTPASTEHPAISYIANLFGHDCFGTEDHYVFFLFLHSDGRRVIAPSSMKLSKAATPETILWLEQEQAKGYNVYISMAPFPLNATSRQEHFVATPRNVFVEADNDEGGDSLAAIRESVAAGEIPEPHSILQSSPGKFHIVWHVEGFSPDEAKAMNRALCAKFFGDSKSTDLHRVLRLPGFLNLKPERAVAGQAPVCELIYFDSESARYTPEDFKIETIAIVKPESLPAATPAKFDATAKVIEERAREAKFDLGPRGEYGDGIAWNVTCPWADGHETGGKSALLMLLASGAIAFNCFHKHCADKNNWQSVREFWAARAGYRQSFEVDLSVPPNAPPSSAGFVEFPEECLIGPLKDIVNACPLPKAFMFLTMVTMFGSLAGPNLAIGQVPRRLSGRLDSLLLTPGGGQKGSTLNLCKYVLQDKDAPDSGIIRPGDGIGSGESLTDELAPQPHACLTWDEMTEFFNKGQIERSSLFNKVATLYYETTVSTKRASTRNSNGRVVVNNVWLSLIGGLQPAFWENAWNHQSSSGLFRRFQIAAIEKSPRVSEIPTEYIYELAASLRERIADIQALSFGASQKSQSQTQGVLPGIVPGIPQMTDAAKEVFRKWSSTIPDDDIYQSLDENAMRVSLILAAMCGTDITADVATAAIAWGSYQKFWRKQLAPSSTFDQDAAVEARIVRHLPEDGKITWGELSKRAHLYQFGTPRTVRVRDVLSRNGVIGMKQIPSRGHLGHTVYVWKLSDEELIG